MEQKEWLKQHIVDPFVNHFDLHGKIKIQVYDARDFILLIENLNQINIETLPKIMSMYNNSIRVKIDYLTNLNYSLQTFDFDIQPKVQSELIVGATPYDELQAKETGMFTDSFDNFKKAISKYVRLNECNFTKATILSVETTEITSKKGKVFKKLNGLLQDNSGQVAKFEYFNLNKMAYEKAKTLKANDIIIIAGCWDVNDWDNSDYIKVANITRLKGEGIKKDKDISGTINRYELNVLSKMSAMDSINDAQTLVNKASAYGLKGMAITDENSVQGVNDIENVSKKKNDFKAILGCQLDVLDDTAFKLFLGKEYQGSLLSFLRDNDFYVFDTETTGLSRIEDKVVQMSCLRMSHGQEQEFYDQFANPEQDMPKYLRELTHLVDVDLSQYPTSEEVILDWYNNFLKASEPENKVLVAHNAQFDLSMIDTVLLKNGLPKLEDTFTIVDTLTLARFMLRNNRSHRLGELAVKFELQLDAHNALNDARATGIVMYYLFLLAIGNKYNEEDLALFSFDNNSTFFGDTSKLAKQLNNFVSKTTFITSLKATQLGYGEDTFKFNFKNDSIYQLNKLLKDSFKVADENGLINYNFGYASPITILPKDIEGRKVLYQLISKAHAVRFYRSPRIWLTDLLKLNNEERSHLLIGTGANSMIDDELRRLGKEYVAQRIKEIGFDYIEVLPPFTMSYDTHNNDKIVFQYKVQQTARMLNDLKDIEQQLNIPVVAISNSHYTLAQDALSFEILNGKFSNRAKPQYLRKPDELLQEYIDFGLDEKVAKNWVYDNTVKVAEQVTPFLPPTASKLNPPIMPHAKEELKELTLKGLKKFYGDNPDKRIIDRMNTELNIILNNGYETIYLTAHKLVKKANENGYMVGSRGSVGSSLVALFCGITEINALPPHYRSINGNYTEFVDPKQYSSGYDLPPKKNPIDGTDLIGDGHNIPFETFLGEDGSKIPDIDLNFDSSWQSKGQEYMKELFGENHVIRVGTISTLADKVSYGYVTAFERENHLRFTKAQREFFVNKIAGTKKTTGQHPAGILVVPRDKTIEDFTPLQYPANKPSSDWHTSHLPMTTLHDCLLKMDILGHDNPLVLRLLKEMTGVDPHTIKPNDKEVLSLFTSNKALNLPNDFLPLRPTGAIGLPEFGTDFVLQMLKDSQPKTFSDLVQISGLSHGTNVWIGNAKDLIDAGTATLKEVIGTRDKLMTDMLNHGLTHSQANEITTDVKKKRPISKELLAEMRSHGVPEWYIDSAQKIKYMFPMGHAVSYTQDSFRIAWFKIHYPWEFYTTYFSIRDGDVGLAPISYSVKTLQKYILRREEKEGLLDNLLEKQKQRALIVMYEAKARGIRFSKPDINLSEATKWSLYKDKKGDKTIIAPLISIKGLGEKQAKKIVEKRQKTNGFETQEQAEKAVRTKKIIDSLRSCGAFKSFE